MNRKTRKYRNDEIVNEVYFEKKRSSYGKGNV